MLLYNHLKKHCISEDENIYVNTLNFENNKKVIIKYTPNYFSKKEGLAEINLYENNMRIATFIEYFEDNENKIKIKYLIDERYLDGDFGLCWYESKNDDDNILYKSEYKNKKIIIASIEEISEILL